MTDNRKRVKHYHEPGDLHELTFSCYRQLPLLTNDVWRRMLCESIHNALEKQPFQLIAFVLMPEHVHLLANPTVHDPAIDRFLFAIKKPFSFRIKKLLEEHRSPLLRKLTIRERPGKMTFRFWQEGPGYDRNLNSQATVLAAIDYIHLNPVRRGLVERARDWKWSSARWYESDGQLVDSDLPQLTSLPPEFFTTPSG